MRLLLRWNSSYHVFKPFLFPLFAPFTTFRCHHLGFPSLKRKSPLLSTKLEKLSVKRSRWAYVLHPGNLSHVEIWTVHNLQVLQSWPSSGPKPAPLVPQAADGRWFVGKSKVKGVGRVAKAPKNMHALSTTLGKEMFALVLCVPVHPYHNVHPGEAADFCPESRMLPPS